MRVAALLMTVCCGAMFAGSDKAPDWVMELSTRQLPAFPDEALVAVLLDEAHITVNENGTVHRETRYAIRVLNEEGRKEAFAGVGYFAKVTKIHELKAWLVAPGGAVRAYGKESVSDLSSSGDFELYSDTRAKTINAHDPPVGSTFAWECVEDEPLLVATEDWSFQHRDPVMRSRLVLTLPQGWQAQAAIFHADGLKPIVDGTTYTWELKDLPYLKHEKQAPAHAGAWMGVSFFPTSGSAALPLARNWADISGHITEMTEGRADSNDALVQKVHELANGAPDSLARIRAIGGYVQKTKYVAIETNLARGGGYQPHLATQVLQKNYGDCKDKANLVRAMLNVIGIRSYLVAVYSGDPYAVQPEWPSPDQFNHMIIAIQAPADLKADAIVEDPTLGRLLIFDPTNPYVPVGDLPRYEEGSYGLVLAGAKGKLLQLPVAADEADRTTVEVDAELTPVGSLKADVDIKSVGDSAAFFRSLYAETDNKESDEILQRWFSYGSRRAAVSGIKQADSPDKNEFDLKASLLSGGYAQIMQGRVMVFKPDIVSRFGGFEPQPDKREHPYVLEPECYHKTVKVKLPDGFKVDEMPEPAKISGKFGKYESAYKVENGELVFTEDLDVKQAIVPADEYAQLKNFFAHVNGAERAPLLLMRN